MAPALPVTPAYLMTAALLVAPMATVGCHTTGSTTPNTTEQIRPGIANATAFQNLPRIRSLEQASGRNSVLVRIVGPGVEPDTGRITSGNGWEYEFAEPSPGGVRYHMWRVTDTGAITVRLNVMLPRPGPTEIGPFFTIDSDQAVRLAREYGGQRYLDRYQGAWLQILSTLVQGIGTWEVGFRGAPASERCEVYFVINARTGGLIPGDTSCLDR